MRRHPFFQVLVSDFEKPWLRGFYGSQCAKSKCHLVNKHCSVETMCKYCVNVSVDHRMHILFFLILLQNKAYNKISLKQHSIEGFSLTVTSKLYISFWPSKVTQVVLSPPSVFHWSVNLWRGKILVLIYKSICLCEI